PPGEAVVVARRGRGRHGADFVLQAPAPAESLGGPGAEERLHVPGVPGPVGDGERVVDLAEAAGVLAHAVVVAEVAQDTEGDVWEDRPGRPSQLADDRSQGGHVERARWWLDPQGPGPRVRISGQGQVGADRMVVVGVADRPQDRVAVRDGGEAGEVL